MPVAILELATLWTGGEIIFVWIPFMLENTLRMVGGEGEEKGKISNCGSMRRQLAYGQQQIFFSMNKLINLIEKCNLQREKEIS